MTNVSNAICTKLWGTVIDKFIIRVEIQTYAFVLRDMNDYLADVIDDRIQATMSQITNTVKLVQPHLTLN